MPPDMARTAASLYYAVKTLVLTLTSSQHMFYGFPDICIYTDRTAADIGRRASFTQVDACIYSIPVLRGHFPERVFDYHRGVATDPQLQINDSAFPVMLQESAVPCGGFVPAVILHKAAVGSQVHGHRSAA